VLSECDRDREAEVQRRQQTDDRLLQVFQANRLLTTHVESGRDSAAAHLQVDTHGDSDVTESVVTIRSPFCGFNAI